MRAHPKTRFAPAVLLALGVLLTCAPSRLLAGEAGGSMNNPAYVETELDAEAELENASRLVSEGRLADAVTQYLQVRSRFPDKLHLLFESKGRYQLFVPIRCFVDHTTLRLPARAREYYLRIKDPEAKARFEKLRARARPEELRAFLLEYDASSFGAPARLLLGDRLAEGGAFRQALRAWEPLLERGRPTPDVVRRIGYAYARLGRHEDLRRLLRRKPPGTRALETLLGAGETGHRDRAPFLDPGTVRAVYCWHFKLASHTWITEAGGLTLPGHSPFQEDSNAYSFLHPAVADGVLYLNLGREQAPQAPDSPEPKEEAYPVIALHLRTGRFVSGPTPWEDAIAYHLPGAPKYLTLREPRLDLGVAPGLLLAPRWVPGSPGVPDPGWKVAALDLSPGDELHSPLPILWDWELGASDVLPGPGPVGDGKRVYVSFMETKRDLHHWVAALDARTGRELWRSFVSSYPKPQGSMLQPSPLLVREGTVFFTSNMGTVAALDATTGALKWVFKYAVPGSLNVPVWYANSMVFENGVLVAAPREFPFLVALEPETGRPLWSFWEFFDWDRFVHYINTRFRADGERYDFRFRHLLGVRDGLLVYTSRTQVHARSISDGRLAWIYRIGSEITGRGCIVQGRIFVPTSKGVVVLDLELGRRPVAGTREFLLEWADFEEGEGASGADSTPSGGNLLVVRAERSWCFKRPEKGARVCRGRLRPQADGTAVCTRCNRVHARAEEVYLVAVRRDAVTCFTFVPKEESGPEEGGRKE